MDRDETARRSEGNHAVVTNDLKAANATADILSPKPFTAPVVGSLINLLRRFGQPFVRLFLPQLARQQQFNAHVVRHMNEHMNELQETIEDLRNAAEELSRLEERFVERSEVIDRRFSEKDAEKDAAFNAISARFNEAAKVHDEIGGQIGELMSLRSLLRKDSKEKRTGPFSAQEQTGSTVQPTRQARLLTDKQ